MREEGAIPITSLNPTRHLAEGGEHRVELSEDRQRVMKHTKGGLFGFVLASDAQSHIVLTAASPVEYMERQAAQEKLFPTDLKLEGSHPEEFGGLTYSQKFITGTHPDAGEVRDFMGKNGFKKVTDAIVFNPTLTGSTWFHPRANIAVGDARTVNFIKTPDGRIFPFDLLVVHAPPGSAFHEALLRGIE
jgi:hypothetical protein